MRHRKGVHMGKISQSVLNGGKLYPSAHRCLQTQWGQTPPRSQSRKAFLSPSSSPDLSTWSIRVPEDVVRRGHFLRVGGGGRKTHPFTPLTSLLGSLIGPDPKREKWRCTVHRERSKWFIAMTAPQPRRKGLGHSTQGKRRRRAHGTQRGPQCIRPTGPRGSQ